MWKWETEQQPKAVVAILHNAYEHHRWYAWLIEKLRMKGFHVVMGDLPGHGQNLKKSRLHDEQFQDYYKYIRALVTVAKDYNLPVFLIGQGFGATVTMRLLQKEKVEVAGIIAASPWLQLKLTPGTMSKALSSLGSLTANIKLKHELPLEVLTRNPDAYSEMTDDLFDKHYVTVQWYKDFQNVTKRLKSPEQAFPDVPLLLMVGGKDRVTDSAVTKQWLLQQRLSEFYYKEWANCYHDLYFEIEREDVLAYTTTFMENVLRSLGYVIE